MKKLIFYSLIIFLLSKSFDNYCQETITLKQNEHKYDLDYEKIEVFEDKSSKLTFQDIRTKTFDKSSKQTVNTGYSNSKFWYKIKLKNKAHRRWLFNISGTIVDQIEFYEILENGQVKKRVSGDFYPFSQREVQAPTFSFYMDFAENETRTLIVSIKSNDTKQFNFFIRSEEFFNKVMYQVMFRWFFYFGMLFMMVVYNLLLYFSIRDNTYLYYVFYIASFAMLQFTIFGYGNMFIWGENVWFGNRAPTFFAGLTTIFITLFSYKYLNIKELFPRYRVIFVYLLLSGIVIAFTNFMVKPSTFTNQFPAIISLPNVLIMLFIGTKVLLKGYEPAKYYMVAWGVLFFSLAVFIVNALGIFPKSNLSNLILPFGCLVEVTLLSFALGKRITSTEMEKTEAQKEVVKQLKENEKVRGRIARDLHDDLGSTLSSINILSEFAKNEVQIHPEKIPNILQKINESSRKLQDNLQDIVWTTQNTDQKIDNLLMRMRLFGGEILEAKNIDYQIDIDKNVSEQPFNSDFQYDIFMIFKEAINNIVKYSNAQKVIVKFFIENSEINLSIADNGIGFETKTEKGGNGLKNMKNRAEKLNGIIKISSLIEKGTMVELRVPVPI